MLITFATEDGRTEQLDLAESLSMEEVRSFIEAMLGVSADVQTFVLNGAVLPRSGTLGASGAKDGDFILVRDSGAGAQQQQQALPNPMPAPAPGTSSSGSSSSSSSSALAVPRQRGAGGGPVYWDGMLIDDVMANNKNPKHIVEIVQSHPRLLQELNFHNSKLADSMRKDKATAVKELRTYMMLNATQSTLEKMNAERTDKEMEQRLHLNPMDEEANRHFGEKIRKQQVMESYMNMMENYPESLTRVLMLYIEVKVNGVSLQAFVDSGAQQSVMSARCAEKCNVARLIDERFAGQVVGVGTGRTLGRVHVVDITIEGNYFPISLTVMDDSQGLGDTNMEFLLGLDMLKRHRCTIDLAQGKLLFHGASGQVSTPFLHEKDLPESKGGTKGFNPNALPKEDQ